MPVSVEQGDDRNDLTTIPLDHAPYKYSRDDSERTEGPQRTGYSAFAEYDGRYCTLSATKRNSPSPFETRSSTDFYSSLPLRMMTTSTSLPTAVSATTRDRSFGSLTSLPSNLTTTSPGSMPAGLAGPLSSTPATSAPRAGLMLRLSPISSVTCWIRTPSQPRRSSPNCRS